MNKYIAIAFISLSFSNICMQASKKEDAKANVSWWNSKAAIATRGGLTTFVGLSLIKAAYILAKLSSETASTQISTNNISYDVMLAAHQASVAIPLAIASLSTGLLGIISSTYGLKRLYRAYYYNPKRYQFEEENS